MREDPFFVTSLTTVVRFKEHFPRSIGRSITSPMHCVYLWYGKSFLWGALSTVILSIITKHFRVKNNNNNSLAGVDVGGRASSIPLCFNVSPHADSITVSANGNFNVTHLLPLCLLFSSRSRSSHNDEAR